MSSVVISISISRMRAFCGEKSSPATSPLSRRWRRGATRPLAARRVDLIVQHDEDALAARFGAAGDAQRVDKVHAGIRAEGAGGALGPDQDDRLPDAQGEVQEKRRLFERRGAMRDDKTGEPRIL